MDLPFKNSISDNDSGKTLTGKESKVDTTPANEKEEADQEKGLALVNQFNKDGVDTSNDGSEEEDDSDDESEEDSDDEAEEDKEDDEDSDKEDSESDKSEEESEQSDEEDENQDDNNDSKSEWEREGFDTPEAYIAHLKETPTKDEPGQEKTEAQIAEHQRICFNEIFEKHKNVLPESAKENYLKFWESQNNAFLAIDPSLNKLIKSLDKISEKLPFKERLSLAVQVAFPDKIAKVNQRKGEVIAEIRTQKVNKSTSTSAKGSSDKSQKTEYTPDQLKVAEKMGVPLP